MKSLSVLLSTVATTVTAFPGLGNLQRDSSHIEALSKRAAYTPGESNCGPIPCGTFNEKEQLVSIEGDHVFVAPGPNDLRGPCPGLNAAANHGYLPHNGVLTIADTINGLAAAYGMGADLAAGLAAVAILFDGDLTALTWSIGGPQSSSGLNTALFGTPRGLSFSHNNYEGDASIGRPDAYLNNGNPNPLDLSRFKKAYELGMSNDRYTIDLFREGFVNNIEWSIANNPYYFSPQFAGLLVAPAAYNFVINFMSNHTAQEPSGYLNGAIFKEFFAVSGDYPNFSWTPGHEKIPANWYRRTSSNPYSLVAAVGDVAAAWIKDPRAMRLGGNTNGVNTYLGVDPSILSGGAFNAASLLQGNNLGCFLFQAQSMYLSSNVGLAGVLPGGILGVEQTIAKLLSPITSALGCPQLSTQWDFSVYDKYPGAKYTGASPSK